MRKCLKLMKHAVNVEKEARRACFANLLNFSIRNYGKVIQFSFAKIIAVGDHRFTLHVCIFPPQLTCCSLSSTQAHNQSHRAATNADLRLIR
ncbi:hypothetical protein L6452_28441 [Arctium lappa]|uniref:Uncharacterized protein n=1 Tax=Arctium lappa TaxID=4217 RepID=A0ACB8ZYY1_ARCLA|nr:hypothetical protein L6452_28441 [Arctium lappa]